MLSCVIELVQAVKNNTTVLMVQLHMGCLAYTRSAVGVKPCKPQSRTPLFQFDTCFCLALLCSAVDALLLSWLLLYRVPYVQVRMAKAFLLQTPCCLAEIRHPSTPLEPRICPSRLLPSPPPLFFPEWLCLNFLAVCLQHCT